MDVMGWRAAKDVRGKELRLEWFAGSKVCKLGGGRNARDFARKRGEQARSGCGIHGGE
jgi:hypothetical protein